MQKAVILVSGGLDSATTLAIARQQGYACYAVSFDYGQRHISELNAAKRVVEKIGVEDHKTIRIDLDGIGGSALTDTRIAVPDKPSEGIPVTYVPARNTVFLSLALGWAEVLGARDLFIGVNAVDYSGYPDCRPEFISAFEKMANLATKAGVEKTGMERVGAEGVDSNDGYFHFHTPLMNLTKAEIIQEGVRLDVDYSLTVSCYAADDKGAACGVCDSCRLRIEGFFKAGIADQTHYQ